MPYKEWEKHYAFLNEFQLQDPIEIIHAAATGDSIFKDRLLLFEIFYAALGSRVFQDHEAERIQEFTYCWERMIDMIECCHRLAELLNNRQVHYSYSGSVTPD